MSNPNSKLDSEFLEWIHERLVHVHNEHKLFDYMHRLRAVIARVRCTEKFMKELIVLLCEDIEDPYIDRTVFIEKITQALKGYG
jgi:hypothetical protein